MYDVYYCPYKCKTFCFFNFIHERLANVAWPTWRLYTLHVAVLTYANAN